VLAAEADAPSFDLSATLSLVTREGRALPLSDGHALCRGDGAVRLAMRPLCVTLAAGERLRLSVAGACFPAYPVNPGTGTDPRVATGAEAVPITLAIRCGAGLSRLELPVVA
jgi:predicted acyl esterase